MLAAASSSAPLTKRVRLPRPSISNAALPIYHFVHLQDTFGRLTHLFTSLPGRFPTFPGALQVFLFFLPKICVNAAKLPIYKGGQGVETNRLLVEQILPARASVCVVKLCTVTVVWPSCALLCCACAAPEHELKKRTLIP